MLERAFAVAAVLEPVYSVSSPAAPVAYLISILFSVDFMSNCE